jgi:hypothetical protein
VRYIGIKAWEITFIIVVTHLALETGGIDGLFCDSYFLPCVRLETRRVNGGLVDTNFFTVDGSELRVDGRFDADFLTVTWLELGSVSPFSQVNLSVVWTATIINFDSVSVDVECTSDAVFELFYLFFNLFLDVTEWVRKLVVDVGTVFTAVMGSIDLDGTSDVMFWSGR